MQGFLNKMKIVIMSDVHINSYFSKKEKFLNFLSRINADKLILNGDIFDIYLGNPDYSVFEAIKKNNGIISWEYIRGNHDKEIDKFFPEIEFKDSLEIEDLLITHGHDTRKKSTFLTKMSVVLRNSIEKVFKFNIRLFLKKITFGYLDKELFKINIDAANKYPDKKVILGHTHIPKNEAPYYNCGCMADEFFSYMEIYTENGVSNIKLIVEEEE